MTLTDLSKKQTGRINKISGPVALRQRLTALGVLRGQPVRLSASALWGNPRTYYIGQQQICLRNEDAVQVKVELCDG
ncbi:MAG: FeoA family protein [Pontibacterium sp.]